MVTYARGMGLARVPLRAISTSLKGGVSPTGFGNLAYPINVMNLSKFAVFKGSGAKMRIFFPFGTLVSLLMKP